LKQNVLVVGGAGYIGSHMVCTLQDAGHTPIIFDNLSRGHADAVGNASLFVGDLRSQEDLDNCFKKHPISLVMHFAALAYVGESVLQPELYYQNNVVGALNLLSAMRRHDVKHLVFSSTCATYGEPEELPLRETNKQSPINPYGRTKLMIEQALTDYGLAYGLQSVALRYFNAAGADPSGRVGERHSPETHLIPLVLAEALRLKNGGDPEQTMLAVFGNDFATPDGSCIRDYIHVSDLCQAHLNAAERLWQGKVSGMEAYNLANGLGFSVLEVIQACREITGQAIQYKLEPRRAGDPSSLIGSASKATEVLGWLPKITNHQEIIQTAWKWASSPPKVT